MATVCSIDYIGETFLPNQIDEVTELHMKVENDFRIQSNKLIEAKNSMQQFVLKNKHITKHRNIVDQAMHAVNAHYERPVVTRGKYDNGNQVYYNVNVAKFVKERAFRTKSAIDKANRDPYRVVDGEIVLPSNYNTDYERKAMNLEGTPLDTLEEFFKKAEHMQKIFNNKGVDTYVMLDGDQIEPGQLLSDNNKTVQNLRREGIIRENTKVIVVNPNMMYNDVITHEYAHLFIDMIGGMSNIRIENAYNKLIGTDIYNRVAELYNELDRESDKFKKEVVATALGEESNKVFANNTNDKTWWDNFKEWVFLRVSNLLNVSNKNVIKQLAEELINGNFSPVTNVSPDNYYRKAKTPLKNMIGTRIDTLSDAKREISLNINRMINTFEKRTGAKIVSRIDSFEDYKLRDKKSSKKVSQQAYYLGRMKAIEEALSNINTKHYESYILEYVDLAFDNIHKNYKELQIIKDNIDKPDSFDMELNLRKIESIQISNSSFALLEKLNRGLKTFTTTPGIKKQLEISIRNSLAEQNKTYNEILEVATELLVIKFKPMEGFIIAEKKEQLEVEYNQDKNNPAGRVIGDETKEEFINRIIQQDQNTIEEETEEYVRENLAKSISDVGTLEFFLRSEKSIGNMTIRLASRILDKASYNSTKAFLEKRAEAQEIFEEYNSKHGSLNQRAMWAPVTQHSNGEVYLKTKYDIKFFEEYNKISREYEEAKQNDKLTELELEVFRIKYDSWVINNTVHVEDEFEGVSTRIPKTKWLNKEYAAIKANPNSPEAKMLSFLEKILKESDDNYNNKLKLRRSPFGDQMDASAVFTRMPAIRRDTLEKAVSGDIIANAKDTIKGFVKFQNDDIENFGTVNEEMELADGLDTQLMKQVLGNTQGEEKHNIPIYFRGKFDSTIDSMDVMTSVMSDYYMSSQFKEKTEIQPLLDLLLTVTENKEVGDTVGIRNLSKIFKIGEKKYRVVAKEGSSNEYEKLKSMIENRLYNITSTDFEFGKIAQTVMAWTGSVMMSMNFFSGVANVMQGKTMNFLESVGGNFYNTKNLKNAENKFFADMGGWMNDLGSVTNKSKTRLMIDMLNVQGDFIGVKERYIRSNRGLALASRKTLTAPNAVGEFYTQATLMYAMLDNIKVRGKDGNYLDKEFKPTKDVNKAISLDEAMTVEKGILKMHNSVHSSDFSPNAKGDKDVILEEARAFIKKVSSDLHGQYDRELQSHFQRGTWGKFMSMFRKWLVPGFDRRWRGTANLVYQEKVNGKKQFKTQTFEDLRKEDNRKNRFFSSDTKQFQEGTYTTFARMMFSLYKEGEMLSIATMSLNKTGTWDSMIDSEKANVKKTATEYAVIALTIVSAYILRGLAEDLPEDDPSHKAMLLAAFTARRLHMELFSYVNPLEALVLMKSPAASVSLLQKSSRLILQILKDTSGTIMGEDLERYERGDMKDQLKIKKYFSDVIPVSNQINRNLDDAVTFLFQSY